MSAIGKRKTQDEGRRQKKKRKEKKRKEKLIALRRTGMSTGIPSNKTIQFGLTETTIVVELMNVWQQKKMFE